MFLSDSRPAPVLRTRRPVGPVRRTPGQTVGVGQTSAVVRPGAPVQAKPVAQAPVKPQAFQKFGNYVGAPRPMSPEQLAAVAESTALANRDYQEALARQGAGVAQQRRLLTSGLMGIDKEFYDQRQDAGDQLGSVGLGKSPAFMGRALVKLRDQQLAAGAGVRSEAAEQEAALQELVERALRAKRDTDARNARDTGRAGADVLGLLRSVL